MPMSSFGFGQQGLYRPNQPAAGFTLNPASRMGAGPFGAVPGAIGVPSAYNDLSGVYPNLSGTNSAASSAIMSKLRGELSPDTIMALQEDAARFGVANGMPGAGAIKGSLVNNRSLRDIGRAREDQISQGIAAYNATVPTVSQTQTVRPETQIQVAETNAVNAAAPDPTQANKYAEELFNKYLEKLGAPAAASSSRRGVGPGGFVKPWWMPNEMGNIASVTRTKPGESRPYETTYY